MENLSFQYPAWYVLLCVACGLLYAFGLYYKDRTFTEQYPTLPKILAVLRFLSVTLLAFLLLKPLLKSLFTETKKPVIVLAQDQSESVGTAFKDGELETYKANWEELKNSIAEKYEVKEFAFGGKVREGIDFEMTDKISNLSKVLADVSDLYGNQNLGAVVMATDGIYNEGSNPLYAGAKLNVPVYTVALGDTTLKKDLKLKRVFHNRIAYLGDKFSVQIDVAALNAAGSNTKLTVSKIVGKEVRKIQELPISIDKTEFFTTKEVVLSADESGVQRYRISLGRIAGEASTGNNTKEIFVDVLDARQKILLLANAPHPDISALRQVLEKNKNYQVTVGYANKLKENVADFDFVVLHNLPSSKNDITKVLNVLNSKKLPRMFIVGSQTNLSKFNAVQPLLTIQGDATNSNDVQGIVNNEFSLFTIDDNLKNNLSSFNPLSAPFGDYKARGDAQVFLYQRIGKVDTKYPLLLFGEENEVKIAVLAAEGIWRWRLFDYLQHQNHNIFEELIGKDFQYSTLKSDKRRFRISLSKNIFDENEPIVFDGELYNESYELVNGPDLSMTITNPEGRDFNFTFNRTSNAYTLSAGVLPVGGYRFKGKVNYNGQNLEYNGQFTVQPIQLELYETTAEHGLLRNLSQEYGGAMFYPSQLAELGNVLDSGDIKPIIYSSTRTRSIINVKWIFFLLLGLLSVEWFFRRYFGGY